ncbi:hypothetical protein OEZ86_003902 [Tetradesmus obliquus]|nr:hypothetical protein OEZ86_003902 [Tetradesmus obliquus]
MQLTEAEVYWWLEGNVSEENEAKVSELRQTLGALLVPGLDDRVSLLRFLKARHWNVAKAAKMYQAMATWRTEHEVDQLLDGFEFHELPLVRKHYPHFYHKTDKYGRPVYIELLGQCDIDQLLKVTTIERFTNYHIQQSEAFRCHKLPACTAAAGRTMLTHTIILDMAGLSPTRHFTLTVKHFLENISRIDQNNFPEHLGCLFMINTPLLFRGFWSVIKGFLDERTLAKIKVLGSGYLPELLAVIPAENLPTMFGGKSACDCTDLGPWQDASVVSNDPALIKAAAAGQLELTSGLAGSSSSNSLKHSGSLIGTAIQITAGSPSSSGVLDEAIAAQ